MAVTTAPPTSSPSYSTTARGSAGPIRLVAGVIAVSAVTIAVVGLLHPWGERLDSSSEEILTYGPLRVVRDTAWAGILVDGLALALLAWCLAIGVTHLVRDRGRWTALAGAVLVAVGGVLYAMGSFGFVTLVWFATGLPERTGTALMDYANPRTGHLLGVEMAGFALFTLGCLVLGGALAWARAVPLPAVLAFAALTVTLFTPVPNAVLDPVQAVQTLLVGAVAIPVWRSARRG